MLVFRRWKERLRKGGYGCVSSIILWIKFKFSRAEICVVMGYDPNEGDGEKRDRFWNEMERTLDSVGNGYGLCIWEI